MRMTPTPTIDMKEYTTIYNKFKGVDFSQDASLVDKSRSPNALNLISGEGFLPEKRPGWRELHQFDGPINGEFVYNNEKIIHAGTKIYKYIESTDIATELITDVSNARSVSFYMGSKLYIKTSTGYYVYDGTTMTAVVGKTPIILISRSPSGGGTLYEGINLLSDKKTEQFLGNGTATTYQLSANALTSIDKVEVMDSAGVWVTYTMVTSAPSATQYTQDLTTGQVTFNAAKNPPLAGVDNVKITYTKPIDGYKDRILKCTIINLFGVGGENRVFMSGNPDYKSQDWFSGLYDPTYFSDLDYSIVGTEETAVVGYTKYTNYQMAVKRTSQTQGTVYKRKGSINSSGEVEFTLETGISGLGAIGKHTFANLIDEPLFLTTQGIYAISTFNILSENVMRNRSFFVDNRLIKEPNLENAIACEYKGLYMLFINSHVYVLDSKQIGSVENDDMDFVYECYYWDNVPAYTVLSHENDLYFGTEDGKLCKFNYDLNTLIYNDDGEPINAYWYTTNDDDDAPQLEKTVQRLGNSVTIKPFTRTSATVYYIADSKEKVELVHGKMNVFSFNDINFNQFTFNTIRSVKEIYFKKQIKKYKRLQFMVENKALNEPFGVFSIIKTYTKGNLAKK